MSLALLFHYLMLNMFRMLIHPSSGACDLFHGLYRSVRIEVFALARLFSRECLVVTCVVVLESVFLQILANAKTCIHTDQYNPCNNSTNKSQAPEHGCINIRNMLSIK